MVKKIDISTPKYPDTYALVDDDDYERIISFGKWRAMRGKTTLYAVRWVLVGRHKKIHMMHRAVMGLNPERFPSVDHINHNGLDNRKSNLRVCTNSENGRNKSAQGNNASGYKGVSWKGRDKRWRATIRAMGKHIHLGTFDTPEAAADAYDKAALKYHGEFARTNAMIRAEREKEAT